MANKDNANGTQGNDQHGNPHQGNGHENDHGNNIVTIFINDIPISIHRGNQTVAAIKIAGNVPSTDILFLMPNYESELKDNGSIVIKGEERFKSCAPSGASS
jgi:hypothetical protein